MLGKAVRSPAVAGRFYPGSEAALRAEVERCLDQGGEKLKALGVVSPHAGYVYSGPVAGKLFGRIEVPKRVVILGPNHRGAGARAAVCTRGAWATPLGEAPLDAKLGQALAAASSLLEEDDAAHRNEHSLEVQLPFLQRVRPDVTITPVCLKHLSGRECAQVGRALAEAIRKTGEPVLIVASSDMTHYEPDEQARERDRLAIDAMLRLDPDGLLEVVESRGITMCGVIPATVMLHAVKALGAKKATLVDYRTSGDASGDYTSVVGYAGLAVC